MMLYGWGSQDIVVMAGFLVGIFGCWVGIALMLAGYGGWWW